MKTKTTPDLFGTAKTKTIKSVSTDEKQIIITTDKEVANALVDYEKAKKDLATATANKAIAEGIIKPYCRDLFLKQYRENGKKPESFIISNNLNDSSLLYYVSDAYKKIDKERYDYLSDTYGKDVVSDNSTYLVNDKMIQKYGAQISQAITNAKNIPAKDKGDIIEKIESYSIAKGTIEKLKEFAKKAKSSIITLFDEIIPTQGLKARGSVK